MKGGQGKKLKEDGVEDKDILDNQVIFFRDKNKLGFHNLIIPIFPP